MECWVLCIKQNNFSDFMECRGVFLTPELAMLEAGFTFQCGSEGAPKEIEYTEIFDDDQGVNIEEYHSVGELEGWIIISRHIVIEK